MNKKEISLIVCFGVLGVLMGLALSTVFVGFLDTPESYGRLILTQAEKTNMENIFNRVGWLGSKGFQSFLSYGGILIAIIAAFPLLLVLNPRFDLRGRMNKQTAIKAVVVILCSAAWIAIIMLILNKQDSTPVVFVIFSIMSAGLWFLAGEMGWAGDLAGWGMSVEGHAPRPVFALILGCIAGLIILGETLLVGWLFERGIGLISVFNMSGELWLTGMILQILGLVCIFTWNSVVVGFMIIALAPAYCEMRKRIVNLIIAVLLAAVPFAVYGGVYLKAAASYDAGKKDIAAATGIPATSDLTRTIILFKKEKKSDLYVHALPMQATAQETFSLHKKNTIAVSAENLKKLQEYIDKWGERTAFRTTARYLLVSGYDLLWDTRKALELQFALAEKIMLSRMYLLNRLKKMPVTQESQNYLKAFSDEKKWIIGKRGARLLAEGYWHIGNVAEAKKWLEKAKAMNDDVSKIKFEGVPVTTGKISGRILINGKPPVNTKVAILEYDTYTTKFTEYSRLLDARDVASDGRFVFPNLGSGEYTLVMMTDSNVLPHTVTADKLKVTNIPDAIKIQSGRTAVDLGTISITKK